MTFFPLPSLYGVVRIDPVASVQDLDDPEALDAARRLDTKYYLVYFRLNIGLPLPTHPWSTYNIWLVAPGPPPPEPEVGIEADMFTPISPSTARPQGREPLRTDGPFPFPDCAHWLGTEADVRVKHGEYPSKPEEGAVKLPVAEFYRLVDCQLQDGARQDVLAPGICVDPYASDKQGDADRESSDDESVNSLEEVSKIMFSAMFPKDSDSLLPVVDAWTDMTQRISYPDQLANPLDFLKEQTAIEDIIKAALARKAESHPRKEREAAAFALPADVIFDKAYEGGKGP